MTNRRIPPQRVERKPQKERRAAVRGRVLLGGKLVYGQGDRSADCVIRDLTELGARIRLASDIRIPDEVWLIILRSGIAHRAVVVWRSWLGIGLKFVDSVDLRIPIPEPLRHLHRLWLEGVTR